MKKYKLKDLVDNGTHARKKIDSDVIIGDISNGYGVGDILDANAIVDTISDFVSDTGYITKSVNDLVNYYLKGEVYTKTEVADLIAAIQQFHYEIYASTSAVTSPASNVLYLVGPTGTGSDKYEEYVYADSQFVKIGDTSIDLSGYYTKGQTDTAITQALNTALADYTTTSALTPLLAGKQDVIDAQHKLSSDLIDDSNTTNKFTNTTEKQAWNSKQDALVSGTNIKTLNGESILGGGNMDIIGSYTPTLLTAPTSSTTTYIKDSKTINFEIGQFARVLQLDNTYKFYQLTDLATISNVTTATWVMVSYEDFINVTNSVLGINDIPQFDVTETYAIGDFVMYDGKLYKFLTGHASGAWNPAEVLQTNLVTEVDNMVKSDYEEVIIDLKTEMDNPLPNVNVMVTVEGELSARNLTTDSSGRCSTNVLRGLEYSIDCNNVENYLPINTITKRASLPKRTTIVTYVADDRATVEHLKVTIGYSQVTPETPVDHITVTYGEEDHTVTVTNNIAEVDIPMGTTYIISFPDLTGYYTPRNQQYIASSHSIRPISIAYHYLSGELMWLMNDNTVRSLNGLTTNDDEEDIFGLIVQTSGLSTAGASFVIPYRYVRGISIPSGQYLSANELIPNLGQTNTHAQALANDKNGESNCLKILDYINVKASQNVTRTSSMVTNCKRSIGNIPTFNTTENYTQDDYVVYNSKIYLFTTSHSAGVWDDAEVTEIGYGWLMPDGVIRQCFTPSYAQIYAFRLNIDSVNDVIYGLYGHNAVLIASNEWWTSTLYNNSVDAVHFIGGGYYHGQKVTNRYLLPVLAY